VIELHAELAVRVTRVQPWGVEVATDGGEIGFIDPTKLAPKSGDQRSFKVRERLNVVVLDESRVPFRASALPEDFRIARNSS
jgi:hypothetical protein